MSSRKSEPYKIKGVNALFDSETIPMSEGFLAIAQIIPAQSQPRRYFDDEAMVNLVASVRQHGILQPLLVRPIASQQYQVIAGERRYRAAVAAGLTEVPVVIKILTDLEAQEIALLENLQREDLNPLEETEAILQFLALKLDKSPENIKALFHQASHRETNIEDNVIRNKEWQQIVNLFKIIGRFTPESFRTNRLPLLNLQENIKEVLLRGQIEYTKARVIARLQDDNLRKELLQQAIDQGLSLAEIKKRIASMLTNSDPVPILKKRLNAIGGKLKMSGVLNDPKKQKQIESLLNQLETLVSGV